MGRLCLLPWASSLASSFLSWSHLCPEPLKQVGRADTARPCSLAQNLLQDTSSSFYWSKQTQGQPRFKRVEKRISPFDGMSDWCHNTKDCGHREALKNKSSFRTTVLFGLSIGALRLFSVIPALICCNYIRFCPSSETGRLKLLCPPLVHLLSLK